MYTHVLLTCSNGHIDAQVATSEDDALQQARKRVQDWSDDLKLSVDTSAMGIQKLSDVYAHGYDEESEWMQIAPIFHDPLAKRKVGLPTFPILDGMIVGKRDDLALEWLLKHGTLQSGSRYYRKLSKVSDTRYDLTYHSGSDDTEEHIAGATDIHTLIDVQRLDIQNWLWYSTPE